MELFLKKNYKYILVSEMQGKERAKEKEKKKDTCLRNNLLTKFLNM